MESDTLCKHQSYESEYGYIYTRKSWSQSKNYYQRFFKKTPYNGKAQMHQRVVKILNLHGSNYRVSKYLKQTLTLSMERQKNPVLFGYFNTLQLLLEK